VDIKDLRFSDPDTGRQYVVKVTSTLRHMTNHPSGNVWATLLLDRPILTLEPVETILKDEPADRLL